MLEKLPADVVMNATGKYALLFSKKTMSPGEIVEDIGVDFWNAAVEHVARGSCLYCQQGLPVRGDPGSIWHEVPSSMEQGQVALVDCDADAIRECKIVVSDV